MAWQAPEDRNPKEIYKEMKGLEQFLRGVSSPQVGSALFDVVVMGQWTGRPWWMSWAEAFANAEMSPEHARLAIDGGPDGRATMEKDHLGNDVLVRRGWIDDSIYHQARARALGQA